MKLISFKQLNNFLLKHYMLKKNNLYKYIIIDKRLLLRKQLFLLNNFFYNILKINKNIFYLYEYTNINYIFLLNLVKKNPKINLVDLVLKKKYIYTIGIILNLINISTKSARRSNRMLKYLVNFVFKKIVNINRVYNNFMVVLKGLNNNILKIFYFLNSIFYKFNVNFFLFKPMKTFNLNKIKKSRSIKKRIKKRLINFERI